MANYDFHSYYLRIPRPLDDSTEDGYMPLNQWRYICEGLKSWDSAIQDREVSVWEIFDKLVKEAPSKTDKFQ
jgi:hypothetical protein